LNTPLRTLRKLGWGALLPLAILALLLLVFALPATRRAVLRSAGWALVKLDPPTPADIIVIANYAGGGGALEAADLVRAHIARRVVVFLHPPDAIEREFVRRGARYLDPNTVAVQQLHELGIQDVEQIPWPVSGSTDEGKVLRRWCHERGIRSVVFISTSDHSRRAHRIMERTLGSEGIRYTIRYSHYGEFNPDSWWLDRGAARIEVMESQKLLLDYLQHPLS